MGLSALVAFGGLLVWQLVQLRAAGSLAMATIILAATSPGALILGLLLLAHPRLKFMPFIIRALAAALLAALLSYPSFVVAANDPGVQAIFNEAIQRTIPAMGTQDPALVWQALSLAVASSIGSIMLVFLLFSTWIGTRIGQKARLAYPEAATVTDITESSELIDMDGTSTLTDSAGTVFLPQAMVMPLLPPTLRDYQVPSRLVWALLAAWTTILLTRFVSSQTLAVLAWNAAIALSICYGIQGFAVATALAGRVGMAPVTRLLAPVVLILLLVNGTLGIVAVGILAVLGTLETWIPFRPVHEGDIP
jgi:hypothetical protein